MRGEIHRKGINNWSNHMLFHFQEGNKQRRELARFRWCAAVIIFSLLRRLRLQHTVCKRDTRSQMWTSRLHLANELLQMKVYWGNDLLVPTETRRGSRETRRHRRWFVVMPLRRSRREEMFESRGNVSARLCGEITLNHHAGKMNPGAHC